METRGNVLETKDTTKLVDDDTCPACIAASAGDDEMVGND